MKINLKQTIRGYEGKESIENGKPIILRDIISTALNNFLRDEIPTAEVKNKAFQLSIKLYSGNEADFTLDDRAFIKERVDKIFPSPLICGRVAEILEEKKDG